MDENKDLGAFASEPGSREPSPSVSALTGFDPSRWKDLAMRAIDCVHDAERETNWGDSTFGPSIWERLRDEQNDLLSAERVA